MTEPAVDQLTQACREELKSLWYDLLKATRRAIRCTWSIEALGIKERIQKLTQLVGPTPWECIQWDLLESGIYEQVHAEIDITVTYDAELVAEGRARQMARRL